MNGTHLLVTSFDFLQLRLKREVLVLSVILGHFLLCLFHEADRALHPGSSSSLVGGSLKWMTCDNCPSGGSQLVTHVTFPPHSRPLHVIHSLLGFAALCFNDQFFQPSHLASCMSSFTCKALISLMFNLCWCFWCRSVVDAVSVGRHHWHVSVYDQRTGNRCLGELPYTTLCLLFWLHLDIIKGWSWPEKVCQLCVPVTNLQITHFSKY